MLEEYPTSADEWMAIFNDLYPSEEIKFLNMGVDSDFRYPTDAIFEEVPELTCIADGDKCTYGDYCCSKWCTDRGVCLGP